MSLYSVTDFTGKLSTASNTDNIWSMTSGFFNEFGIDGLVYLDADEADFTLHSSLPESWHQHYIESNYQEIDPFAEICCTSSASVPVGEGNLELYPQLSKAQKNLVQEAGETGFKTGFSSCFRQASNKGFGGWNLMSSEGKKTSDGIFKEHAAMLHLAAFCAHQALVKTPDTPLAESPLTPRQIECLQWLATGLRTQQIAHKMGLKPVTVEFHFNKARQVLGVNTREHALAKALSLGLLQI